MELKKQTSTNIQFCRNSSVELLRIIAMIMIIALHFSSVYRDEVAPSFDVESCLATAIEIICNTGVSIFILITGFYGITFNFKKLFFLVNLTFFYSIFSVFVHYFMGNLDTMYFLRSFVPILTNKYWFVTSYVILFSLSSFINKSLDSMSKKEHLLLVLVLLFFFFFAATLFPKYPILKGSGKDIVHMTTVYIIGRYFKKYGFPNILFHHSKKILLLVLGVAYMLTMFQGYVKIQFALFRDASCFMLIAAVTLFYLFATKTYYKSWINNVASYAFPVYLIHVCLYGYVVKVSFPLSIFVMIFAPFFVYLSCCVIESFRRHFLSSLFDKTCNYQIMIVQKLQRFFYL